MATGKRSRGARKGRTKGSRSTIPVREEWLEPSPSHHPKNRTIPVEDHWLMPEVPPAPKPPRVPRIEEPAKAPSSRPSRNAPRRS